jgi:hypothetical protein
MEAGDREGFIGAALQADGTYAFGWGIAAGGTFEPASIDAVKGGRTQMRREAGNYPARSMKIIGRAYSSVCPPNAASPPTRWTN